MTQLMAQVLGAAKNHLPYGRDTLLVEIHSKKTQEQRTRASEMFRSAKTGYSVLITSDVSARGVDYPGVTRVIQVGVPGSRDLYIHRVGRTGRAGKAGRGDLVLLPWESGFLSWQLNDVPLKPCTVADTQEELAKLAAEYDANPPKLAAPSESLNKAPSPRGASRDRRNSVRAPRPSIPYAPVTPALETLHDSLHTNILPTLDELTTREVFASLLGYYISKAHELRTTKEVVLTGLKQWATGAMGLQDEPYVSREFLNKLGMNDGRTKNRSKPRDGYKGFGGGGDRFGGRGGDRDGGFRGRSDRGDRGDRGDRESRPRSNSYAGRDRDGGDRGDRFDRGGDRERSFDRPTRERSTSAPPPSRYGEARDFDRPARRESSGGFGYGGGGGMYGKEDADAWEKKDNGRGRGGRY